MTDRVLCMANTLHKRIAHISSIIDLFENYDSIEIRGRNQTAFLPVELTKEESDVVAKILVDKWKKERDELQREYAKL